MKTFVFAAAMAVTGTAVSAEEMNFFVGSEYQFEAEVVELNAGVTFVDGKFTIAPEFTAVYDTNASGFDFDSAEVTVSYAVNETVDVYGRVETDSSFEYSEAAIGITFNF